MSSLQGPYADAYATVDDDYDPSLIDVGQGRTLDEANASILAIEACIVAALLLAALVWVLA